jgi:hypothetical protein
LFQKAARERDLADEIESHLQMHIDDNLRAGMSPQEAKRVANMKLGGVDSTKEAYRDRSTIPFLESLVRIFVSLSGSYERIRHLLLLPL